MSILSLQSIIQKYGAKYGIDPKTALKDAAKDTGKNGGKNPTKAAAGAVAKNSGQPDTAAKKIPAADSVKLSPAARDFLSSHTGSLGKFEMPNVMDAFMGAMHGGNQGDSGSGTGKSLLDFLSGSAKGNQAGANDSQNSFATGGNASKSLLDFL